MARGTALLGLLRQQDGVNVRQDTTGRDGDGTQKLGQFLVVANGELNVSRHDARLFVIARGVPREFEHFRREVFLRASNERPSVSHRAKLSRERSLISSHLLSSHERRE